MDDNELDRTCKVGILVMSSEASADVWELFQKKPSKLKKGDDIINDGSSSIPAAQAIGPSDEQHEHNLWKINAEFQLNNHLV